MTNVSISLAELSDGPVSNQNAAEFSSPLIKGRKLPSITPT